LDIANFEAVARVRFALKHLTAAADAGYLDADIELCKVHQYLLSKYENSQRIRKSMVFGRNVIVASNVGGKGKGRV